MFDVCPTTSARSEPSRWRARWRCRAALTRSSSRGTRGRYIRGTGGAPVPKRPSVLNHICAILSSEPFQLRQRMCRAHVGLDDGEAAGDPAGRAPRGDRRADGPLAPESSRQRSGRGANCNVHISVLVECAARARCLPCFIGRCFLGLSLSINIWNRQRLSDFCQKSDSPWCIVYEIS